jgi:hypothetical protein
MLTIIVPSTSPLNPENKLLKRMFPITAFNQGTFFSPDGVFEQGIKESLKESDFYKIRQLGMCKIGSDLSSRNLMLAINSIFAHVNVSMKTKTIAHTKGGSYYVNAVVPELYTTIPLKCGSFASHNCASFFQSFLGSELMKCSIMNIYVPHPSQCRFVNLKDCDDCAIRDFQYISGDKFGGKKSKKISRKRTLKKKRPKKRRTLVKLSTL